MKRLEQVPDQTDWQEYEHMGGWWEWVIKTKQNATTDEYDYMASMGLGLHHLILSRQTRM